MTPKHDKTTWFLKKGLLDEVKRFTELEKKISKLSTDKEKGDAFEVFAEAWLATNPVTQAAEVWPFEKIPSKLKRTLGLDTGKDMGVDGLVKTKLGENHAYQVKFRSVRSPLTWRELSTFIGLADKTDRKLVFTNYALANCQYVKDTSNHHFSRALAYSRVPKNGVLTGTSYSLLQSLGFAELIDIPLCYIHNESWDCPICTGPCQCSARVMLLEKPRVEKDD